MPATPGLPPTHTPQTPCPLCHGDQAWLLSEKDRHGDPLRAVMCARCSLMYLDPLPSAADLEKFYTDDYRAEYKGSSSPEARHVWREFQTARDHIAKFSGHLKPGARTLDIGSSLGAVVATLRHRGFRAAGIEPYRDYYEFSRRAWDIEATNMMFLKYQPAELFDAATMFHVMEHIANFPDVLAHIKTVLQPDGLLCIEVPNVQFTRCAPHTRYHKAHVIGFAPFTLNLALRQAGYQIVEGPVESFGNVYIIARNANEPAPPLENPQAEAACRNILGHTQAGYLASLAWLKPMLKRAKRRRTEKEICGGCRSEQDAINLVKSRLLS